MGDSITKYHENQEQKFFFDESPQISGVKMSLTPQEQLQKISAKQKTEARDKIVEILDKLILDKWIKRETVEQLIEIRKLTFKL